MKYCPYCGAELLGGTASFCCECGKSIKGRKTKAKSEKKPPAEKRKKSNIIETEDVTPESENNEEINKEITTEKNDGYDGYYDDILPVDESIERQGIDKTVVKNLIIIIVGVIVAISICVAAMYLM